MHSGFSKLLGTLSCVKICINLLWVHYKKKDQKRTFDDDYAIFFPDFLHKGICCGYSFELHRQVDAIQMGTHNICLYKVDEKYTGCNLKNMKLLDCVLIGVCAVIRSNTVCFLFEKLEKYYVDIPSYLELCINNLKFSLKPFHFLDISNTTRMS